jgi:acetyl-CoA carboxylase biotin carboxyl carrier protein
MKSPNDKNAIENPLKEKVTALYKLMKAEKLEELEIKEDDFYLHMKRKGKICPAAHLPQSAFQPAVAPETVPDAAESSGQSVKSPINGILYRAPSPTSLPFVKEGDVIDAGKTLCIIEAMKVMNEIKADGRLKILKMLVENGKSVNANQDLFLVERV